MTDTYPAPAHGWTCFHCGETFADAWAARDHFGTAPVETPACIIKADIGLLHRLRITERARDEFLVQRTRADDDAAVAASNLAEVLRAAKAANPHEVRFNIDYLEGRVIAAEAVVAHIEASHPALVEAARDAVCKCVPVQGTQL